MKIGIIIAVVVAVLLLGGGAFAFMGMSKKTPTETENVMMKDEKTEAGMFSSIKDALSKNLSIQCDIKDPNGLQTVVYIKNGKIRSMVTGKTPAESGNMVMMNSKMYFWNDTVAMVVPFDVNEVENPKITPSVPSSQDPQAYLSMVEQYKKSCKTASVDDALFVLPTGVTFKDMSEMMKVVVPSGVVVPTGSQEKYNQMMQQYAQPQ